MSQVEPSVLLVHLVESCDLDDITFLEISAKRTDRDLAELSEEDRTKPIAPSHSLGVDLVPEERRFRLRLGTDIVTVAGPISVVVAAEYDVDDGFDHHDLTMDLAIEFANNVGIMMMLPYLRQAIADVTQRVFGTPLQMPILPRGALTFDPADAE